MERVKRTKRWVAGITALAGIAGMGTLAVIKGPELTGQKQETTAETPDESAKDKPVEPIKLTADNGTTGSPVPGNPLRGDARTVRGQDDSAPTLPPLGGSGLPGAPPPFSATPTPGADTGGSTLPATNRLSPATASAPSTDGAPPSGGRFGSLPQPETPPSNGGSLMPTNRFGGGPPTSPTTPAATTPPAGPPAASFGGTAGTGASATLGDTNSGATAGGSLGDTAPTNRFDTTASLPSGGTANNFSANTLRSGGPPAASLMPDPVRSNAAVNTAIGATPAASGSARPGTKELDGTQTPSLAVEKFAPAEIQIGKPAKFQVKIRNVGQAAAESVVVRDYVPEGTQLIDTTPPAAANPSGEVVWQIGTLESGEEKTVSMQLMPTAEGEIGSVASVTFAAQAGTRTKCTRPKLVLETVAPQKVLIGQDLVLQIRLSNPGTGAASRVVLEEDVPEGLAHEAGAALEFDAGTLKPGETRTLELRMKAAKAGRVLNVLRARAEANLSAESTAEIEVIAPQLAVAVNGPNRRFLERQATHEIRVANPGTAPAHNVEMVAHLPKGLKFVSTNNQGQYDARTHAVYWSLEQLAAGDAGSVTLSTLPLEAGEQKILVDSKADMNLTAQREHIVGVDGLAALMFEVTDAADPIEVNGETVYEIRVINQGSAPSSNVRLAALLPPALKPIEAKGPTTGAVNGQQVIFQPLRQLNPKADAMYTIRVKGVAAGNQIAQVRLLSDEIQSPVTEEESTRVYADQ